LGQSGDATDADAASHRDMNALETVNNTAGEMLENASKRISQMQAFLQEKGLLQEYRTTSSGDTNNDGKVDRSDLTWNLSFDQAVSMAKQHDSAVSAVQSQETPEQHKVEAYRKLTKSTWEDLHNKMAEVTGLSDFMSSKGVFHEYQTWARAKNADANKAMIADRAKKSQDAITRNAEAYKTAQTALEGEEATLKKQHSEFIKNSWQQYKFNQEQYTKRQKYSEKYRNGYHNGYNDNYGDVYGGGY
jgi:hypothetical protein